MANEQNARAPFAPNMDLRPTVTIASVSAYTVGRPLRRKETAVKNLMRIAMLLGAVLVPSVTLAAAACPCGPDCPCPDCPCTDCPH